MKNRVIQKTIILILTLVGFQSFAESKTIGAVLSDFNLNGTPIVIVNNLVKDGPAERSGLFPGDWIAAVNGTNTSGMDQGDVLDLIGNDDSSNAVLTVLRFGEPVVLNVEKTAESSLLSNFLLIPEDSSSNGGMDASSGGTDNHSPYASIQSLSFQQVNADTIAVAMIAFITDSMPGEIRTDYYFSDREDGSVFHSGCFIIYSRGQFTNVLFQTNKNLRLYYQDGRIDIYTAIDRLKSVPREIGIFLLARNPSVNMIFRDFPMTSMTTNYTKIVSNRSKPARARVKQVNKDLSAGLYDKLFSRTLDVSGNGEILAIRINDGKKLRLADPSVRRLTDGSVSYRNRWISPSTGKKTDILLKLKKNSRGGYLDLYIQKYLVRDGKILDIQPERICYYLTGPGIQPGKRTAEYSGSRYRFRVKDGSETVRITVIPSKKNPVMIHELNFRRNKN